MVRKHRWGDTTYSITYFLCPSWILSVRNIVCARFFFFKIIDNNIPACSIDSSSSHHCPKYGNVWVKHYVYKRSLYQVFRGREWHLLLLNGMRLLTEEPDDNILCSFKKKYE